MQQVLMNLCLNAVSAMPTGGRLSLATGLGQPPGQQGDWACVTVADTGVGMTPEVQRRIFEPFFSTRERGTGLGLAVVKQILTQFGGRIDVDSEPDRGTRVDIWLPLLEDTAARPV
jgi:signal transduction histidine kinase